MSMALKLFHTSISPPSRAVLLTIRNLGLEVEVKKLNLLAGDHLTPEFLQLNPEHKVPVLVDDDFVLTESRAIMAYLVNSRKPGSDWYPTDPRKRAVIDQRLYYDATVVFERNGEVIRPVYSQSVPLKPQKDLITETMKNLNFLLENNKWFAGDKPTIADLSILPNVSQIHACGFKIARFTNLSDWLERCKTLEGFDENQKGAQEVGKYFQSKIPKAFD